MSDEINKDTVDYRDPIPFDDTKLNSITEISKGIRHKLYGKDVREAIAQGIERTYEDASKNGNANMEVEMARGTEPTLNDRLDKMDDKDAEVTAQLAQASTKTELAVEKARIDSIATLASGSTTGDAELIDGRIGADATAYPNIGDAIRGQVRNLKDDVSQLAKGENVVDMSWEIGNLSVGAPIVGATRLRTTDFYTFNPFNVVITVDVGYKFNIISYDLSGTYIRETGWTTTSPYTFRDTNMDTRKYKIVISDVNNGNASLAYGKHIKVNETADIIYDLRKSIESAHKTTKLLSQNTDSFVTGSGFIGDKLIKNENGEVSGLTIKGGTELVTTSDNSLKDVKLENYCNFYTADGGIKVTTADFVTYPDGVNILSNTGVDLAQSVGYNQLIMSVDLLSAYSSYAVGTTQAEKIAWINSKLESVVIAFTGWAESSDNTINFKQRSANGTEWVGSTSSNIVGSVPTTNSRNVGVNDFLDANGKLWVILYANVQGPTTLHIDFVELSAFYKPTGVDSKALWHVGSRENNKEGGLSLTITESAVGSHTLLNYGVDGDITLRSPLRKVGDIYDQIVFEPNAYMQVTKRVGKVTLDTDALSGLSVLYDDTFDVTTAKIPLSVLNGAKSDTTNIVLYSFNSNFDSISYGKNKLMSCCYIENGSLNVVINGNKTTTQTATTYLLGSVVLYELDAIVTYDATTSNPYISGKVGQTITIGAGYLTPSTIQDYNTDYTTVETELKQAITCEQVDYSTNKGTFEEIAFSDDTVSVLPTIRVNQTYVKQLFYGSGAALTESAAYQFSLLSDSDRTALLEEMFSPNKNNLSVVRLCMGQSDFRVTAGRYTYDDFATDLSLNKFTIGEKVTGTMDYKYIIPILKEIVTINPTIKIIACPWVYPPIIWDSNFAYNSQTAGYMANYILKFIQAYEKEGFDIFAVSVLNEPEFYPFLTPSNIADLTQNYLGVLLAKFYPNVKIIGFESNYRETTEYNTVADGFKDYIDAIGVHTYNGTIDSDVFLNFLNKNKELELYVTERRCMSTDTISNAFNYMCKQIGHDAMQRGCNLISLWNMSLDEDGKPAGGGNFGRRGVLTISSDGQYVHRNLEYYMLTALSNGISPNSHIVASSSLDYKDIYSTALMGSDGDITVVVFNYNNGHEKIRVNVLDKNIVVVCKPYGITRVKIKNTF